VLVGYSFGADALPAIIPRLPADLRHHVKSVVLIGDRPDRRPDLPPVQLVQSTSVPDAYPVVPAIAALKGLKTTCVYGDQRAT
jgi:type IV secretory pathway VirJ component